MSEGSRRHRAERLGALEPIAALNRVKILEYAVPWSEREPLVDIRAYCPEVVIAERCCPYLRQRVAEMLNQAQASLPTGYRLQAHSALRTLYRQKQGWDTYFEKVKEEHPNWPLSALRRATNRYFAPYDQKAPPGHCTGGAVDVALLDADGVELDVNSPAERWDAAYTWSEKPSAESKANRMRMVHAMLGAGFSNCREEYWHYSWGDSAWAVRVGEVECPYGWTYPPVALETGFPDARAGAGGFTTERDAFTGKPLRANGVCKWLTDAGEFRVGVYWGQEIPVTLRVVHGHAGFAPPFTISDGEENWTPIEEARYGDETVVLQFTPQAEKIQIANFIPPPPEKTGEP